MHHSKLSTLEAYALHGSVSYGPISAARLRDILLGALPSQAERSRVRQALMEMPASSAHDLAAELGMTHQSLNDRAVFLFGQRLPQ